MAQFMASRQCIFAMELEDIEGQKSEGLLCIAKRQIHPLSINSAIQ